MSNNAEWEGADRPVWAESLGPPLKIRASWIRARLRVPLEPLLAAPVGARIDDSLELLHLQLRKAVDRIGEEAESAAAAVRRRAEVCLVLTLTSLAVFAGAMIAAVNLPAGWRQAFLAGSAGAVMAKVFAGLHARLLRDVEAVEALGNRFREFLALARTSEHLHWLEAKIRADLVFLLGQPKIGGCP